VDFEVRPVAVEERVKGDARAIAAANAMAKAEAAREADPTNDLPILGVDTVVALDGVLYGKPASEDQARNMLEALAGRTHEVVSGLAVLRDDSQRGVTVATEVSFRRRDDDLIDWYLETGEWRDRAGGYAIQGRGAALVDRIRGDYLNVVGLPVSALLELWPTLIY
jgi:septum formation protein